MKYILEQIWYWLLIIIITPIWLFTINNNKKSYKEFLSWAKSHECNYKKKSSNKWYMRCNHYWCYNVLSKEYLKNK